MNTFKQKNAPGSTTNNETADVTVSVLASLPNLKTNTGAVVRLKESRFTATYLNEERVKCLKDARRDCLSKVGEKCDYASCFWIFCLYSEKSRCEIDETRKCYDYSLGGCLTEWQARYLQGYAKENVSQICEVIIHMCSLFYGISMFIGDWRIISQRRHPRACQNLSHKEEMWAIVSHLITLLFMLSVAITMYTLFENDPRRHCSFSVFLLAVYLALSLATQYLPHHGFLLGRASMDDVKGVQINDQDNVQGNIQGNGDERRSSSAANAVSTGREHEGSDILKRKVIQVTH